MPFQIIYQLFKNGFCDGFGSLVQSVILSSSDSGHTSSIHGSLGVVKNIEFKIVAYLPRFFMLVFVKFYASIYRILLYSVL